MPWYPPARDKADVFFWYGTYIVTGLAILAACGAYYWVWVHGIPRWRGHKLRQQVVDFGDGAQAYQVVEVPAADVAAWDSTHGPRTLALRSIPSLGRDAARGKCWPAGVTVVYALTT